MDRAYMAYRELRIEENRKRRIRIARRQRIILAIFITIIVFLMIFLTRTMILRASSDDVRYKYYTSVTLHRGDSLISVAEDNYTDDFGDIESYIDEVCSINHIADRDMVHAGESIIVPYYSDEFK